MQLDQEEVLKTFNRVSRPLENTENRQMSFDAFYTMMELYVSRGFYQGMMSGMNNLSDAVTEGLKLSEL